MKLAIEIVLAILLHPIAVILVWINLLGRTDLNTFEKVVWAVFSLIPIVPILYVLVGGGDLW